MELSDPASRGRRLGPRGESPELDQVHGPAVVIGALDDPHRAKPVSSGHGPGFAGGLLSPATLAKRAELEREPIALTTRSHAGPGGPEPVSRQGRFAPGLVGDPGVIRRLAGVVTTEPRRCVAETGCRVAGAALTLERETQWR